MYKRILVTLEGTPTDRAIIDHVKALATLMQSQVILLHVAAGAAAKYHGPQAAGEEVEQGRTFLTDVQRELTAAGIPVETHLAYGDPAKEIVAWVQQNECDLVAMSTHGHQFVADLVLGTTAIRVQHNVSVPVLLLRAK